MAKPQPVRIEEAVKAMRELDLENYDKLKKNASATIIDAFNLEWTCGIALDLLGLPAATEAGRDWFYGIWVDTDVDIDEILDAGRAVIKDWAELQNKA